jgi:hypothetical protein
MLDLGRSHGGHGALMIRSAMDPQVWLLIGDVQRVARARYPHDRVQRVRGLLFGFIVRARVPVHNFSPGRSNYCGDQT